MPYFGAGVDQHVNLTFTPTWLFTPTSGVPNTVRIYNEGQNTIYIGGLAVTQNTGIPLPPGSRPLEFNNPPAPLYGVSAYLIGNSAFTGPTSPVAGTLSSIASAYTAGASAYTISTAIGISSGLGQAGMTWRIGSTFPTQVGNQEVFVTATSAATTAVTTTNAALFPHQQGEVVYAVTPTYGQVRVTAGT